MASPQAGNKHRLCTLVAGAAGAFILTVRLGAICLALPPALVLHFISAFLPTPSQWPRRFLLLVARLCGARINIKGKHGTGKVLYLSNHLSWIDIPILCGATGCAFVSHDGVESWPIIGWLARLNDTIFVARTNRMGIHSQIEAIRSALTRHRSLAVFPEGTTGHGRHLLPFKPSLLKVLDPPPDNIHVQPVLIDYGHRAEDISWYNDEPLTSNAWRLLSRWGGFNVTLHMLDAFDPAQLGDRKAISAHAFHQIASALAASKGGPEYV